MAQKHNAEYTEKPMTRDGRIQGPSRRYRRLRHPTFPAAEWTAKNPLLQRGEIGVESDTHKIKVGDGLTYWNNLAYSQDDGQPKSTADYNMGNSSGGWTAMSTAQQDALNSGATTTNITQIGTNTTTIGNHIADTNNPHNVTATQVGLGNVDNTSDVDKPISTATQNALDLKANIADLGTAAYTDSTDYATAAQGAKADTALQAGDNVSDLVNDAGYLTQHQTLADLGITATASEINVLDGITASTTELNYVDGVTSNIQTQIDGKQPKSTSAYNMGNTSGGWTAMSNTQQDALNSGANTTNIGQIATNTSNIADEIIDRQNADNGLQSQIDAIVSKSDVVDIVGTYAELQAYDTSSLGNNDVVKVISDSTHNNAPSYYRWVITGGVGAWVYIGSESETYTKAETDALLNAKQDNITATDGITLTGTTLTNSGVRAVASGTVNGTISVNTNGTSADVAVTGLGSAAYTSSSDYATSAQGGKADTAVQPGDLATVATSGSYTDLSNKPTIPTTLSGLTGDVDISSPTNGQHLVYDGAKWKNTNSAATVSWGDINGTLSDQTDLQNALDAKANDNAVVHLAGTETINGDKNFTGSTKVQGGINLYNPNVTKGTTPASMQYWALRVNDSSNSSTWQNTRLGVLEWSLSSNNTTKVSLIAYANIAGSSTSATISVGYDATNSIAYTSAPTPTDTTTTSGQQIATTGWVNTIGNNVVHITGTETITGSKTFTQTIKTSFSTQYPAGLQHKDTLIPNNYSSPASDVSVVTNALLSNADDYCAYESMSKTSAGVTRATLAVRNRASSSGSNRDGAISVSIDSSGKVTTYAPSSDANNSIVTTVNKSKAGNGYFKFGNGLIVQWGLINTTGNSRTLTFPTAFSSADSWKATITPTGSNTGSLYTVSINDQSTTGATILSSGNTSNVWLMWIAIGY